MKLLELRTYNFLRNVFFFGAVLIFSLISVVYSAELNINILAVNGTNQPKEKEIKYNLPKELSAEDILDTNGLKLEYDVSQGSYIVTGIVSLGAKETKTYKVRIRDVWKVEEQEVSDIKSQVDASLKRIENTEYAKIGDVRKESLLQRLDYIVDDQQKYADDIESRIDRYRTYSKELEEIRSDALSVSYWRAEPPSAIDKKILKFIIEVNNPDKDKVNKTVGKHYMPSEVKPEHIVDDQGFKVRYDPERGQSFLTKEEDLRPLEKKRYELSIVDVWRIAQNEIDNLKERSRKAFKLLENSEYKDSASYLVDNIKVNLTKVEDSQAVEREIKDHIGVFKVNQKYYSNAKNDVEALEDLLNALRENLERSKVKNVLQKIKSVRSLADIAESIFGVKPSESNAWKIILGIVIFVGLITIWNFSIWGKRSKDVKLKDIKEQKSKEPEKKA